MGLNETRPVGGSSREGVRSWRNCAGNDVRRKEGSNTPYGSRPVDGWYDIGTEGNPLPEETKAPEVTEEDLENIAVDCPECGRTFKNANGLWVHMHRMHKDS